MKKNNEVKNKKTIITFLVIAFAVTMILISILLSNSLNNKSQEVILQSNSQIPNGVVQAVQPSGQIDVYENSKLSFTATALTNSQLYFKIGSQKVQAKISQNQGTYSIFAANLTMPGTKLELDSLSQVVLISSYKNQTEQVIIGTLNYKVPTPTTTQKRLNSDNFIVTKYPDITTSSTQVFTTTERAETQQGDVPQFSGGEMCEISANYADMRSTAENETTILPYVTPLVKGTMDYIVSQSEAYDVETDKTLYFFELGSGKKVKREDVNLVKKVDLGDNTLKVLSCSNNNSEIKITFETNWKIPYSFSFDNQAYFEKYMAKFNVSSFTSNTISFTFYYTTSIIGNIDVSGSNVVSSSRVSTNSAEKSTTITMPLINQGKYYGYKIEYDENSNLVLTINNKIEILQGSKIVLDPGHGGKDSGAIGLNGGVYESNLNIAIATRVKSELENMGATVIMTRNDDTYLSLEQRKLFTRNNNPDIFVSIHCNSSTNDKDIGVATYYFKPMSKSLAEAIYNQLNGVFINKLYADQPNLHKSISDSTRYYPFSVTRLEECPSTLLEIGYMSNDAECLMLLKSENLDAISSAISNGIRDYFSYN